MSEARKCGKPCGGMALCEDCARHASGWKYCQPSEHQGQTIAERMVALQCDRDFWHDRAFQARAQRDALKADNDSLRAQLAQYVRMVQTQDDGRVQVSERELYEAKAEAELNGEAIMLVREHLGRVGIEAPFFDDVGALAAKEIESLRAKLAEKDARIQELEDMRDEHTELAQSHAHAQKLLLEKLAASEAACAEMRGALKMAMALHKRVAGALAIRSYNGIGYLAEWAAENQVTLNDALERALSSDAGKEYVHRSELEKLKKTKNNAYSERNQVVVAFIKAAVALGWPAGRARHEGKDWEDDWRNVVFVDLPTGQASWHFHDSEWDLIVDLPPYSGKWDGHTTEQKYDALRRLPMLALAQGRITELAKAVEAERAECAKVADRMAPCGDGWVDLSIDAVAKAIRARGGKEGA